MSPHIAMRHLRTVIRIQRIRFITKFKFNMSTIIVFYYYILIDSYSGLFNDYV